MRDLDIRGAGDLLGAEQSGFISDIGFEMYQKILNEAINELKEDEFKELYKEDTTSTTIECQLDTDMEILIPSQYVGNISERLKLYNDLAHFKTEEELQTFKAQLTDRFGPLPIQVSELIKSVKLKWQASRLGFLRISLKNKQFTAYFPEENNSYFQTKTFDTILNYFKKNHQNCQLKELNGKLIFRSKNINSIQDAIEQCQQLEKN